MSKTLDISDFIPLGFDCWGVKEFLEAYLEEN